MNDKEMLCYVLGVLESTVFHDIEQRNLLEKLSDKIKEHIEPKKEAFAPSPPHIYPRFDGGIEVKTPSKPEHLGW